MAEEPTGAQAAPASPNSREVRLREYIRKVAEDPEHQRFVQDLERRVAAGELGEPLDADGLRELFRRHRPS